ncbi:MAG TPA: hypothetical protein VGG05_26290 [Pseudonocardiaceae bacterium]
MSGLPGDPDALLRLADELEGHAGTAGQLSSDSASYSSQAKTSANWTGSAADAYTGFTNGVSQGVAGVPGPLRSVAGAIRGYAGVLKSAQQRVAAAQTAAQSATGDAVATATATADSTTKAATSELEQSGEQTKGVLQQAVEDLDKIWEKSEPVRGFIEKLHAPWDALGADSVLESLLKKGESVTEAVADWQKEMPGEVDKWWGDVSSLAHDADNGLASWEDVASMADRFTSKVNAAEAFTKQWASDTSWVGKATAVGDVASKVLGVTALVGDAGTLIHPEDSGVMGDVDRAAAGVNGALVIANLATDEIPVVGEVTMIATGVYLGGDYLYHHWPWFHDTANTVGHAVATAATTTAHAVASAATTTAHAVSSAASTAGHAASSAWHAATGWL